MKKNRIVRSKEFAQRAQSMDYSGEDSVARRTRRAALLDSAEIARVTAHGEVIDAKFCTNW
jgi:hypothetical protein